MTQMYWHMSWRMQQNSFWLHQKYRQSPIDSVPPHFRHTLWWVCGGVWSKCGSLPHLARTMAARACNQTLAPQFNHKTCYLSGGFVVQVWWMCGPTWWWGCGGAVGLYPTPLDRIGLCSDQIARASRLVMDSGLHTLGWTRQQTVDYMMANSGWAAVDIQNEIDRYISWPGQATSYMLGMIELRRLRTLAESTLGEDFNLRGFHDRLVGMGSVTLPMLEESVTDWMTTHSAAQ